MKHLTKASYSPDQILMTLSAIAYTSTGSLKNLQRDLDSAEALQQQYLPIWLAKTETGFVYVVKSKLTEEHTLVIKGPDFPFDLSLLFSLYENMGICHQVPLTDGQADGVKIGAGILKAIHHINELSFEGKTLNHLINHLPHGTKLFVTGHGTGGSIAAAYSARLASSNPAGLNIIPYIFGAPAAGNESFASLFDQAGKNYLFTESYACVNDLDIIPYSWHDVMGIPMLHYLNAKCPLELILCAECITRLLVIAKVLYIQPPQDHHFKEEIEGSEDFLSKAAQQHHHNKYLSLLGLPPVGNAAIFKLPRQSNKLSGSF